MAITILSSEVLRFGHGVELHKTAYEFGTFYNVGVYQGGVFLVKFSRNVNKMSEETAVSVFEDWVNDIVVHGLVP